MQTSCTSESDSQAPRSSVRYGRQTEVSILGEVLDAIERSPQQSLLGAAQEAEIPESTLRDWVNRAYSADAPPEVMRFVESVAGLNFAQRIVLAARYVITQVAGGGYRNVSLFLELSGLSEFVASSHGSQYKAMVEMEEAIGEFGAVTQQELSAAMRPRGISLACDEVFHRGHPCLVAIEPVSNFIVVEEYADDRTAATWTAAVKRGLKGMLVTVETVTSDGARALVKMTTDSFNGHHSPDVCHVQMDIGRGMSLPLNRQQEAARDEVEQCHSRIIELMDEHDRYEAQRCGPGRPVDYESKIEAAHDELDAARQSKAAATVYTDVMYSARKQLSRVYHPYDIETGQRRDATQVEDDLNAVFDTLELVADRAELSERARAYVAKARRMVSSMVATIAFVHMMIHSRLEAMDLPPDLEAAVKDDLVAAHYLEQVAARDTTAEERRAIMQTAATIRQKLSAGDGPWRQVDEQLRTDLKAEALECARLFQRSSSCTEGRNSWLDLRHHTHHRLTPRKLRALTAIHNFGTRRADGTTAAERFFEQPHPDMFEHLVDRLPPPPRPAAKRTTVH